MKCVQLDALKFSHQTFSPVVSTPNFHQAGRPNRLTHKFNCRKLGCFFKAQKYLCSKSLSSIKLYTLNTLHLIFDIEFYFLIKRALRTFKIFIIDLAFSFELSALIDRRVIGDLTTDISPLIIKKKSF